MIHANQFEGNLTKASTFPVENGGLTPTPSTHFPVCHQKIVRDAHAQEYDPLIAEKLVLTSSFQNATVREISHQEAKKIIIPHEWLGNMGCTDFSFGLYFGEHLAGVECFGRTAGTKVAGSICGQQYSSMVRTLCRGACVHWAHPHSASFLIPRACRLMSEKGFHIFVAYSDSDAGEIGTVYQATNWLYCGETKSGSSMFVWPKKPVKAARSFRTLEGRLDVLKDGVSRDERSISNLVRDRSFSNASGSYKILCTRREIRERMVREGFRFFKSPPKRRYVTFEGDKRLVKELRAALKWNVLPYPRREEQAA